MARKKAKKAYKFFAGFCKDFGIHTSSSKQEITKLRRKVNSWRQSDG